MYRGSEEPQRPLVASKKKRESTPCDDGEQIAEFIIRTASTSIITHKLTKPVLIQVIESMAVNHRNRHAELRDKHQDIDYLQSELEQVKKELAAARDTSRPSLRRDRIDREAAKMKFEQEKKQEEEEKAKEAQETLATHGTQTIEEDDADDADDSNKMDVDEFGEIARERELEREASAAKTLDQPEASSSAESHTVPPETPASKSFLSRILRPLSGYFSPTPAKAKRPIPASLQTTQPQQPLGELPASRKRPAPEEEVTEPAPEKEVTQPTQKTTTPSFTTSTPKATRNAPPRANKPFNSAIPDTLESITEQMEQPEVSSSSRRQVPRTTADTFQTSSLRTPARTPGRRTINQVRSERAHKQSLLRDTPSRDWPRPRTAAKPRLPNADARLEKMHNVIDTRKKLDEMEKDEEVKELFDRPRKRIKVDEAAWIPHRAPGDGPSTWRVPDIDSDGEMEVDEDVEMLPNVFESSHAEEKEKEKAQLPASTSQQPTRELVPTTPRTIETAHDIGAANEIETTPAPLYTVTDVWAFPTVGTRPEGDLQLDIDPYLAKKFDYGFESWKRGQHLVEW